MSLKSARQGGMMSIADIRQPSRSPGRRAHIWRAVTGALLLGSAVPALAQSSAPGVTARVDKLEKEMRAVQRKVFPGGEQAMLAPDIAPPAAEAGGIPAAAPLSDLTARVSSLEQALAQLTGQVEQNGFHLKQIEDQFARFRTDSEARMTRMEGGGPVAGDTAPGRSAAAPARPAPTTDALETGTPPAADAGPPAAAAGPASDDPQEEAYLAGYRAWSAKDYPTAETALKAYLAKYPKGKRLSYAQNLLGRTYLDSGRPAAAAVAFHHNYTTTPRGDRAPESLYYLGQSLMKLEKPQPTKACEAYDTLNKEYGTTMPAGLKDRVKSARSDAKCGA